MDTRVRPITVSWRFGIATRTRTIYEKRCQKIKSSSAASSISKSSQYSLTALEKACDHVVDRRAHLCPDLPAENGQKTGITHAHIRLDMASATEADTASVLEASRIALLLACAYGRRLSLTAMPYDLPRCKESYLYAT
ncbi:hypothetical protein QAD02_008582 [Eretmocerus hayati]|uniref:Uncharacterized protein n=1 Tax=Eretmocerus hayati TaxID=131215 RepID=A0ACC2N6U6_9HYME|nr:hypothetical protein QAD02_008582 [Eretmocerus hayati]